MDDSAETNTAGRKRSNSEFNFTEMLKDAFEKTLQRENTDVG